MNQKSVSSSNLPQKHRLRTLVASFFGTVATFLIISSILIVWANQTLLNTNTYVATIAPLASNATVKAYFVNQLGSQLVNGQQVAELAEGLLPASTLTTQTTAQITAEVRSIVNQSLSEVVNSPSFKQLWITTNRNLHGSLISQLDSNNSTISLNVRPVLNGLVAQLSQTQLAPFVSQLSLPANVGVITINGTSLHRVQRAYSIFKEATWVIVLVTLLSIGLALWISVHHSKTLRRILVGTGILCLAFGLALTVPSIIGKTLVNNGTGAVVAIDVAKLIIRRLQLAFFIIGGLLIVSALLSKLVSRKRLTKHPVTAKL